MHYSHVISLGFFCGVAQEIERQGLRDGSYPFDWCISKDWEGVEKAIVTNFKDFLAYECLSQSSADPNNYKNEYNIQFFHDFTKYKTLREQLPDIQKKYDRRIERFYNSIIEPTLFIRYINDVNGKEEIVYWNQNIGNLEKFLKTYNESNRIVFIANSELMNEYNNIEVYYVQKDKGDFIATEPFTLNKSIQELFWQIEYDMEKRKENHLFYDNKCAKKMLQKARSERMIYRILEKIYNVLKPVKYHDKKY